MAARSGQFVIFTGADPLTYSEPAPINPHPYLKAAGNVVAERFLNLHPSDPYFQIFAKHILGEDWEPESSEQRWLGLGCFSVNGYQTNINIPKDDMTAAIEIGNPLQFSDISIALGSLLNSTPVASGVLTPYSDARLFVRRILHSAGPQELFQYLEGENLFRVNQQVVDGMVPSIARALSKGSHIYQDCTGELNYPVFHGANGRIRGDRGEGNSTWEDMIPSPAHDEVEAAYSYLKACQVSYLLYCAKNNIPPNQEYFCISNSDQREHLLKLSATEGPQAFSNYIAGLLTFMDELLTEKQMKSKNFDIAKQVILKTLTRPTEWGTGVYLDPTSPNYGVGCLSDHIRADIYAECENINIPPTVMQYSPKINRAIHQAMVSYGNSLQRYYEVI